VVPLPRYGRARLRVRNGRTLRCNALLVLRTCRIMPERQTAEPRNPHPRAVSTERRSARSAVMRPAR
jgi:hypothetical protein